MVKYVKGDLLSTDHEIIAHGVNCAGAFGSGVAGQIRKKYPHVRVAYIDKYKKRGWRLGQVQITIKHGAPMILNCSTQKGYSADGVCHVDYKALRVCMNIAKEVAMERRGRIAIPKIGTGLGGGDWSVIEKILENVFHDYDVTVYHLD